LAVAAGLAVVELAAAAVAAGLAVAAGWAAVWALAAAALAAINRIRKVCFIAWFYSGWYFTKVYHALPDLST
jgi:hypothetical protein